VGGYCQSVAKLFKTSNMAQYMEGFRVSNDIDYCGPESSVTDDEKKEVYGKVVRECIDLINEKLKDSDLETKDKLLQVKDRLLSDKQEINEEFIKNVSKLVELRSSLKEN
jgi:hypothetical protein